MLTLRSLLLNRCFYEFFFVFVASSLIFCHLNRAFTVKPLEETIASAETQTRYTEAAINLNPSSNWLKKCDPCPPAIDCVPKIQCPAHVRLPAQKKPQLCDLPENSDLGYCCVTGQNHTADAATVPRRDRSTTLLPHNILAEGHRQFEKIMKRGNSLSAQKGRPDLMHSMVFHATPFDDARGFELSNSALEQVVTTQLFTKKEDISVDDIVTSKLRVEFKNTPLAHHCSLPRPCRPNPSVPYRSIDGACNNPLPHRSLWGAAGQPLERLLPPAYEDGVWMPRLHARDGSLLASARRVSRLIFVDANRPHEKHNLLLMQFGQFISHDILQSAVMTLENGDPIQCCAPNGAGMLPPQQQHFACLPIPIESDDEFYAAFQQRCLNFVRLSLAPNDDCSMSYGKQRNQVTHFLDASTVYGSSVERTRQLRTFRGGRLRMLKEFGRDLLPLSEDKESCQSAAADNPCFESGDGRTNIIISLAIIHLLFAREHNRVAEVLAHLNPNWSDDTLFQEARRIVIAELQHVVYNEYLPALVGPSHMKRFRLAVQQHGYADGYSPDVNPASTNEFSGAAFRMGHTSVDGWFHMGQRNEVDEVIEIPDVMFNPWRLRTPTFYDHMLQTLTKQPMQRVDNFISHGLTRYLFRGHNPFGLDLAAINIQRGRDHSLRPYNDYLELMGLRRVLSFNQLPAEIAPRLSQVYRHPDDIDLWVGGLLEKPVDQGCVGVTFAEIIADQFARLKRGDRFYYEYDRKTNPGAFSGEQLKEIRKTSMARLICDNADHMAFMKMPPLAFVRTDFPGNELLPCMSPQIPFVDLKAWRQF